MEYTEEPQYTRFRDWDNWSKWVLFLLVGYGLTGRSFAYLGIDVMGATEGGERAAGF